MADRLLLLLAVVTGGMGQIFFKLGMNRMGQQSFTLGLKSIFDFLIRIISSPLLLLGMFCYIFSTVVWMYVLSRMDLNQVYPYTALTLILVITSSVILFQEKIPVNRWVGVSIIVVGMIVMSLK